MGMLTRQITVAFDSPISMEQFAQLMKAVYGNPVIGLGRAVNGIPTDWIIVENVSKERHNE